MSQPAAQKSSAMVIFLFVSVLLVVGAVAFYRQNSDSLGRPEDSAKYRREAPAFSLADHAGKIHALKDFRGEVVIVHFWATWCPPCVKEIPQLIELAKSIHDQKLQIVAISLDQTWEDALKLMPESVSADSGGKLLSLLDPGQKVAEDFGSYQYPESYLVSVKGAVVFKWVGVQNWNSQEMTEFLHRELESH